MATHVIYDDGIQSVEADDEEGTLTVIKYQQVRGVFHVIDNQEVRDMLEEDPQAEYENQELQGRDRY